MNDINIYNTRMAKAIDDKLWFVKFLNMLVFDEDAVVYDFGCADGELIRHLAPLFPNILFIGLDNSDDMINLARQRQVFPNERYINTKEISSKYVMNKTSIVIMSSVYHEIVNYCTNPMEEIKNVFQWIKPEYVLFRDMIPDDSINRNALQSDIDKIENKE